MYIKNRLNFERRGNKTGILQNRNKMDEKYLMPTQKQVENLFWGPSRKCCDAQPASFSWHCRLFRKSWTYAGRTHKLENIPINCILNIPCHFDEVGWRNIIYGRRWWFLIGPANERWDAVLLIKQNSVNSFLAFESDMDYARKVWGTEQLPYLIQGCCQLSKTIKCKKAKTALKRWRGKLVLHRKGIRPAGEYLLKVAVKLISKIVTL